MNSLTFSLTPFPCDGLVPPMRIACTIARQRDELSITYALLGPVAEIAIPVAAQDPERRNALWKETCFELFLAPEESDHYWEFNLSPAGHWNVYRFSSYREGMQEEPAFASLPFAVQTSRNALNLSIVIGLKRIIDAGQPLMIGIAAAVKAAGGRTSYWALIHRGPDPDFHRRDSFIVEI
jgi:hypothetical protein